MTKNPFNPEFAHALVIGVGNRIEDSPNMAISAKDAERIEKELIHRLQIKDGRVKTLINENSTKKNILDHLDEIADLTAIQPAQMTFIYFSGHGCVKNDVFYLVSRDTIAGKVEETAIEGNLFAEKLNAIQSDRMLIFLDCCHAGGLGTLQRADVPFYKDKVLSKPDRVIISASHVSQVASLSMPLSIFTYALVEGLAGKFFEGDEKNVTVFNLAMYLRERVYPLSKNKQRPQINILQSAAATTDFSIIRYPNGEPIKPAFESEFRLLDDENKAIDTDIATVKDIEYRNQFSLWINGDNNIQGNNNQIIQANIVKDVVITNNSTTIINNNGSKPDLATVNKVYNETITKKLLAAIAQYNNVAATVLERVAGTDDWYSDSDAAGFAQDTIATSYVGLIGSQLEKLWAIGKDDLFETRQKRYIDKCIVIAKIGLQLISFSLLTDLCKYRKKTSFNISPEHALILKNFFQDFKGMSLNSYMGLFICLNAIYKEQSFPLPIPELCALDEQLRPGGAVSIACDELDKINKTALPTDKYTLENCDAAERQLTAILSPLSFFALYRFVSFRSVGYEEIKNASRRDLSDAAPVTAGNGTTQTGAADRAINADAIWLYKGEDYLNGINLFPFIIDRNALNFEDGLNVCFFTSMGLTDSFVNFYFPDGNTTDNFKFTDVMKSVTQINELLDDAGKRKQLKLDNVFLQFREAKKVILG